MIEGDLPELKTYWPQKLIGPSPQDHTEPWHHEHIEPVLVDGTGIEGFPAGHPEAPADRIGIEGQPQAPVEAPVYRIGIEGQKEMNRAYKSSHTMWEKADL